MSLGWESIRAEALRRIRARDWPPGATIPNEEDLAVEFGVSRATVNRALRELAAAGVLERKRRAGTRVSALPVRKATLDIPVIRQEIEALGKTHSFQLLHQETRPVPASVADKLGTASGRAMLWLETLHLADRQPFLFETRWLNPAVLPAILPDFGAVSVNEWLVSNLGYTLGDIAFTAEPATARDALVLGVAVGAALFVTERCTWSAQDPITFVRLAHAPGYRLQSML